MDTPLNINLDDMTVFYDLKVRLAAVTQEMIDASERRLKPLNGNKKVLGKVESVGTRAIHALYTNLYAESLVALAQARGINGEREEKDLNERAVLLNTLSNVCHEIFWAQAKQDLGLYENESVALKAGWTIVHETPGPPAELMGLLRGTFGGGNDEQ